MKIKLIAYSFLETDVCVSRLNFLWKQNVEKVPEIKETQIT